MGTVILIFYCNFSDLHTADATTKLYVVIHLGKKIIWKKCQMATYIYRVWINLNDNIKRIDLFYSYIFYGSNLAASNRTLLNYSINVQYILP